MLNASLIPQIKSACVGIGLKIKGNPAPLLVGGSGFFIDSSGFFMTASHVIHSLQEKKLELEKEGIKELQFAVFVISSDDKSIKILTKSRPFIFDIVTFQPPAGTYYGKHFFDVSIGKIGGTNNNFPYLTIKKPCKLNVFDEIFLCGFPGGSTTLTVDYQHTGMKTSPIIQSGRISSLMPADHTNTPVGVITDIIGTGGSSGSPILNSGDGEVIGVAQNVITGTTHEPKSDGSEGPHIGNTKIGITYGISNYYLQPIVESTINLIKQNLDQDGFPKSHLLGEHEVILDGKGGMEGVKKISKPK